MKCSCEAMFLPDALFCATCGAKRIGKRPDIISPQPRPLEVKGVGEEIHFPGLSNCLKEGYLVKKGGKVKTWKKRYFVLQVTGKLMYFEHSDGKKIVRPNTY